MLLKLQITNLRPDSISYFGIESVINFDKSILEHESIVILEISIGESKSDVVVHSIYSHGMENMHSQGYTNFIALF